MAEINIKSPALQDRKLSTYEFVAKVSIGTGAGCTCLSAIDIPGLTFAGDACDADAMILTGFEAEADVAIDTTRSASFEVLIPGTLVAMTAAEWTLGPLTAVSSGTAGSRQILYSVAAFVQSTDSVVDGEVRFIIPIKNKDF